MSYFGKVLESLTKKIQNFQRFRIFQRFRVFILSYRPNSERRKRRKIQKISFQEPVIDWGAFAINQNSSSSSKITRRLNLASDYLSRKQKSLCGKLAERSYFLSVLLKFTTFNSNNWHINVQSLKLIKKNQSFGRFLNFRRFRVFVLSYRAKFEKTETTKNCRRD